MRSRKSNTGVRISLFCIALAAIPFCLSLLINIPILFSDYGSITGEMLFSCAGFAFFILLFLIFGPPVRSYLLEHELSHVLFALLSGIRVKAFSLNRNSGYVKTERVNILIALAPYALPLYTLLLIGIYKIMSRYFPHLFLKYLFYSLFGLTLGFHILATMHYLQIYQPDLARYGSFSSLIFISICSLLILVVILSLMFEQTQPIIYVRSSITQGLQIYRLIFSLLGSVLH